MMRRSVAMVAAGGLAAVCSALLCGAGSAAGAEAVAGARGALGGTWGTAQEVPGTAALNKGGIAGVGSVSCASAGNCSAAGGYAGKSGHLLAFVVTEKNGSWGTAEKVPGMVNRAGSVVLNSVSCGSAGNCSAGGSYMTVIGASPAFVVNQANGVWGTPEKLPGRLNQGRAAGIVTVSCVTGSNCGAGGVYTDASGNSQAFAATGKNGHWGAAKEVPGTAALNKSGNAQVNSVSCASAGNCGAGGFYSDRAGQQVFAVTETNGRWGTAAEVPGTAALNTGGSAELDSLSCAPAGNCSAGGSYTDSSGQLQAFVVSQTGQGRQW
jgi:hypothetical protein